jgi:hypothetical protein
VPCDTEASSAYRRRPTVRVMKEGPSGSAIMGWISSHRKVVVSVCGNAAKSCREQPQLDGLTKLLLDHLVDAGKQRGRHGEAKRFGCLHIDHALEFRDLRHWQVLGFRRSAPG